MSRIDMKFQEVINTSIIPIVEMKYDKVVLKKC